MRMGGRVGGRAGGQTTMPPCLAREHAHLPGFLTHWRAVPSITTHWPQPSSLETRGHSQNRFWASPRPVPSAGGQVGTFQGVGTRPLPCWLPLHPPSSPPSLPSLSHRAGGHPPHPTCPKPAWGACWRQAPERAGGQRTWLRVESRWQDAEAPPRRCSLGSRRAMSFWKGISVVAAPLLSSRPYSQPTGRVMC